MAAGTTKKNKKPSEYSSESLMVRVILGICFIALGVLMTAAVPGGAEGSFFGILRKTVYGLSGSLAVVMPVFPIWGGGLLILSSRRKPPMKPFVLSFLLFFLLLAVINLFTQQRYNGSVVPYLTALGTQNASTGAATAMEQYRLYIGKAYDIAMAERKTGGALGMIPAWPVWYLLGRNNIPAVILFILLMITLFFIITRMNPIALIKRWGVAGTQKKTGAAAPQTMPEEAPPPETVQTTPSKRKEPPRQKLIHITDTRGDTSLPWEKAPKGRKRQDREPVKEIKTQHEVIPDKQEHASPPLVKGEADTFPRRAAQANRDLKRRMSGSWEIPSSGKRLDPPKITLPSGKSRQSKQLEMELTPAYTPPPLDLLNPPSADHKGNAHEDSKRAQIIEETLNCFKITAHARNITHGPTVTRYEFELDRSVAVTRVPPLEGNIVKDLAVKSIRIEAPIRGSSLVGIEVPNRVRRPVTLREVLESERMRNDRKPLSVALGKDISGEPIICDIAETPHLLIAGATGSGKSVCINAIIHTLLFRTSPEDVRMILIDPKRVELSCYKNIPHLMIPLITDPHKASGALAWVVSEMTDRYDKFGNAHVRDINGFNASPSADSGVMPRIVVIIDELADLMMQCRKDVEGSICRIAQLARAAGIHLVIATQRPSVDVLTGLIKSNIPSRIAFTVASHVDSSTILDRTGADKLLGKGDMLYLLNGEINPRRVQGCLTTDSEIDRVVDFMNKNAETPTFDPDILEKIEAQGKAAYNASYTTTEDRKASANGNDAEPEDDGTDDLLLQAIEMAVMDGQASISMFQRRLRIGYARSGRLIDEMEKLGIIGSADGAKPRQVLITREEYEQMKAQKLITGDKEP